jgi:hypothetical protein
VASPSPKLKSRRTTPPGLSSKWGSNSNQQFPRNIYSVIGMMITQSTLMMSYTQPFAVPSEVTFLQRAPRGVKQLCYYTSKIRKWSAS